MSISLPPPSLTYPSPSSSALQLQYVGHKIHDAPAPAVVIDVAVARRNCKLMLDAVKKLGVSFRAHVKTHKTVQLAKLQVGPDSTSPRLIASTVSEIELLLPWLLECKSQAKKIDILYGLPVAPGLLSRLAPIARALGEGVLGLFIDHPDQVRFLNQLESTSWPGRIPVFVNIDVGYHREGIPKNSKQLADIARALSASDKTRLLGLYTHLGTSYAVSSPAEALTAMARELQGLEEASVEFLKCARARESNKSDADKVILSIGATPTVTSLQNLLEDTEGFVQYKAMIEKIKTSFEVEVHAGVYPVMDMQQLATRARPVHATSEPRETLLSFKDLGLRTLVEVASVYPDRSDKPEALIAAGSIVLGREPCKSYPGWGVVSSWSHASKPAESDAVYDPEGSRTGWIISLISQDLGVLTWEGDLQRVRELKVGEKLLVWPNHACIAGANFGWYLVVDGDSDDPDRIVDVWLRCRGW